MRINILTLPKISLGLFFILIFIGALHFSYRSVLYELTKYWLFYLFLAVSTYFLLTTAFKDSQLIKENPIISYSLLPLSVILFLSDIWILQTIVLSDEETYKNIYVIVLIIAFFWIPIGYTILNILDKIFKYSRKR